MSLRMSNEVTYMYLLFILALIEHEDFEEVVGEGSHSLRNMWFKSLRAFHKSV